MRDIAGVQRRMGTRTIRPKHSFIGVPANHREGRIGGPSQEELPHGLGQEATRSVCPPIVRVLVQCQNCRMQIRDALPEDAPSVCIVLKRSIVELCESDHRNDPSILARWLSYKAHENFCAWAKQPDNSVLVAVENRDILAVGSVTDAGTIGLNYVSPDARFRGVRRRPKTGELVWCSTGVGCLRDSCRRGCGL